MKKIVSFCAAFLLLCEWLCAQQQYTLDTRLRNANTPIVAQVFIDGEVPETLSTIELGAFVNDTLCGSAFARSELGNTYWIQVYFNEVYVSGVWQDSPNSITFKIYDHSAGIEYASCSITLTTSSEGYGTQSEPIELNFAGAVTQSTELVTGWNWWSTYIEQSGIDGLTMLEQSIDENGKIIKSQSATITKRGARWVGSLTSLQNERGYKINLSGNSTASLSGTVASPSNHPITLNPNWNWIGYPVGVAQTVTAALAGFQPTNGDIIKSQGGTAQYRAGRWLPNTFVLNPGEMFLYYSKASEDKTLVFSNSRETVIQGEQPKTYWTHDIHAYADNLSVIAVIYVDDEEQRNDALELGAFVNGMCRGNANLFYAEPFDRYYAVLTVSGEEGEQIAFGIVNKAEGTVNMVCDKKITFISDDVVGDLETPLLLFYNSMNGRSSEMHATIYPNPVGSNQVFNLVLPGNEVVVEVAITNALGVTLYHETGNIQALSLNSSLVPGIYLINVTSDSGIVYREKLIVK